MRLATGDTTDSNGFFALYLVTKCLQHILTVIAVLFYLRIATTLWKKKVYHLNLTVLLIALSVPSIAGNSMALLMDIFGALNLLVSPLDDVITFVMKSGMSGGVLNLANFIVERIAATILVAKYEQCNENFPFFASAMILMQIAIVILLVYLNMIDLISNYEGTIAFAVICVVSVILFCILPLVSRRAYAAHLRKGSRISIRYQTAENIRAACLLNAYYYVIMFILKEEDAAVSEVLLALLYVFITIEIFITNGVVALSHPSLQTALSLSKRVAVIRNERSSKICVEVTSSTRFDRSATEADVRAVDGRQLRFSLNQEKEMYFRNYAEMWNK